VGQDIGEEMRSAGRKGALVSEDHSVSHGDVMNRVFVIEPVPFAPVLGSEFAPAHLFNENLMSQRINGVKNRWVAVGRIAGNDLDHGEILAMTNIARIARRKV
jgi:hypothetical protein